MIYKKKSFKSRVENLHVWLFSFIALMIVVNTPVKAQNSADKARIKTITTLDAGNDTIVISQIQTDSVASNVSCFSKGLHSMFSFLRENINYQSKAIEKQIQGDIIAGFTISKSGRIINSRIIKGLCTDLDKEVLQTIKEMPEWKLSEDSEDNVDYKITVNFALPDGCSVLEPKVSVIGVETDNLKLTVKGMNGINCGSMTVYGVSDVGGDSIISKTITIMSKDAK